MKASPSLRTLSTLDFRNQGQYGSHSQDLARMPKGTQKSLKPHCCYRHHSQTNVLSEATWAYTFQEWSFQNGLGPADIHLEYLVSNSSFSESKVKESWQWFHCAYEGHSVLPQNKIPGHSILNYTLDCWDHLTKGKISVLIHENKNLIRVQHSRLQNSQRRKSDTHIFILISLEKGLVAGMGSREETEEYYLSIYMYLCMHICVYVLKESGRLDWYFKLNIFLGNKASIIKPRLFLELNLFLQSTLLEKTWTSAVGHNI